MNRIKIIPSKSDAHRAIICSGLSNGQTKIICDGTSKDIEATMECMDAYKRGIHVMTCHESGSTFRFLLPVMGALGWKSEFILEGRLKDRPLSPLYEQLENHGCVLSPIGVSPFIIEGQLKSGVYNIAGNVSSQYISGLMFALPLLSGDSRILIDGQLQSKGYIDLTINVLKKFNIQIDEEKYGYSIKGNQVYTGPNEYIVEGDWSNAAFWLGGGALIESGVCCQGLNSYSHQGDKDIVKHLQEFGAKVSIAGDQVKVSKGNLNGLTVDAGPIPDMVPMLALIGSVSQGTTRIFNAQRLRLKESDRLKTIASVLNSLGADVTEKEDELIITGKQHLSGGVVDSYNDHRIVMMAAIGSLVCKEKVVITNWQAVNKSYPKFFQDLNSLGWDKNIERK